MTSTRGVARQGASIKSIEPAAVLHDRVVEDAISPCFGEGCVGHLVHADGARGGLIDRERIPSQAPPPIGSCYRIARTLDLRQGGEQFGRDGGRGILGKERRILLPSLGRHLVHRAAHGKEHLGRLAYYLIDEVRRGKDGEDGRSLRYLEWTHPPDGSTYAVDYLIIARGPGEEVRVVHDRHTLGVFPRATWERLIAGAGLELVDTTVENPYELEQAAFAARRPT